jgi:hypothetical protein
VRARGSSPAPHQTSSPSAFPSSGLPIEQLRTLWLEQFGRPAPRAFSRVLLARAIAWKMQVNADRDLSITTRREMERLVAHSRAKRQGKVAELPVPPALRLVPGTQLVKVWRGDNYVVNILADGFRWEGSTYRSLSALAHAITGTKWNGMIFFGLRERAEVERKRLAGGKMAKGSPKRVRGALSHAAPSAERKASRG